MHGERDLYPNGEQTTAAAEANKYASEILIPPVFGHRLPRTRDIAALRELADELGITPSIVLGRVQRETRAARIRIKPGLVGQVGILRLGISDISWR